MNARRIPSRFKTFAAVPLFLLLACAGRDGSAQSVTFVPNAVRYVGVGTSSGGYNTDLGVASATRLSSPTGLAFDGTGNLIIADKNNNCVRRVDTSPSHLTTTLAGLATGAGDTCNTASNASPSFTQGLLSPSDVAADAVGNVYIADTGHNCVRELPAGKTGVANLMSVAGTCGAANAASATPVPSALALDPAGKLYILLRDTALGTYQVLRRSTTGALCRVAGAASSQGVAQCPDVSGTVTLNGASGIGLDGGNALYIADTNNNCVRKLAGGTFSTALGTCGSGASAIIKPAAVSFSLSGSMYVTLTQNNQLVRYNQNSGALLVVAGNPNTTPGAYSATQDGAASSTLPLNGPTGLVEDANNNLYVADSGNNIIRQLRNGNLFGSANVGQASSQQVLTFQVNTASNLTVTPGQDYAVVAGTDTCSGPQTPAASGASPTFCSVSLLFTPTQPGNRYSPLTITDTSVTPNTMVAVGLQGVGLGPMAELLPGQAGTFASGLGTVIDLTSDSLGREYALVKPAVGTPQILRYPAGGGLPVSVFPAASVGMKTPVAIALNAAGNLYVADTIGSTSSTPSIQRYGVDGSVNVNYITGIVAPVALAVDGFGNMLIAEQGTANDVLKVFLAGGRAVLAGGGTAVPAEGVPANTVSLGKPSGVALSPSGSVYFSDSTAHVVYSVDPAGKLHPVAGNGSTSATISTSALGQGIASPAGLDVDAAGDLYIADSTGNRVFLYFPASDASANILPIFGTGTAGNTGDGGVSTKATLNTPTALSVTPDGLLHIADTGNSSIRVDSFPAQTLDFGTVAVGSVNMGLQPLVNNGNANLIRTLDPLVSNANFTYDAGDTTCSSVVIYGQLCNFAFNFSPATTGTKTASATVTDNAASSPQTINLTGTVVPAVITAFVAPAETETYGGPYVGTVTITTNGGTVPQGTVTFTVNGTVTCSITGSFGGSATCTLPSGTLLPVRSTPYPVVVTFTAGNYPNQTASTTLTVSARTLTETVNSKSKVYLQPNPILDGTPNGVIQGIGSDSFTVTYGFGATPITTSTLPGTYANDITATVTPNGSTVASNYNIVVVPGTFTITKASLTGFGADSQTQVYGGAYTATAGYTATPGAVAPTGTVIFRNGANTLCSAAIATAASCTVAAGTRLQAGTYTITASYAGDANYTAATDTTTLTVTRAPLTVSVANQTKVFGTPVPNLSGSATVAGLVNGDAVGSTIILTYSTTVTAATPVGTYPNSITVTVGGGSASSYAISNTPGSFTVGGVSTTASLTASASSVAAGVPVTFTATIASASAIPNGTVVFTSDSVILGTVTLNGSGTATLTTASLGAGTHTIRASYSGNATFASSSATLTETVTVPVGGFTLTATTDPQYIRGPGSKTFTVNVASTGGFAGTVSLVCSGLPADASCSLNPASVTLTAGASQSVVITTTTTLADATVARNARPADGRGWPAAFGITAAAAFPMQLGGLGMLLAGLRRRRRVKAHHLLMILLFSFGLLGIAGCGTAPVYHIYPVTVTGTSVGGGPAPASAVVYLAVGTP